jgi:YD repeat-containing protein
MNRLLFSTFFFMSLQSFGQANIPLFQQSSNKKSNKLNSVTEFQLQSTGNWTKTSFQQFNTQGQPTTIIQYNEQGLEAEKKEFIYNHQGQILKTDTYKGVNHYGSTEFEIDTSTQIISFSDYVYSSLNKEKIFLWKTFLEYNLNKTIKKTIKIEGYKKDTSQINFYDTLGLPTKSLFHEMALRTTKTEFVWNKDRTEMNEIQYENDTTVYSTIIHRYKDNKEIERIDTSSQPLYWKYDNKGRLVETNEALFYVLYLTYDEQDQVVNKTINVLFSDSDEKDLPKKFQFKYEYEYRN